MQIGRIKQIVQRSASDIDEVELTVAWYYRPEEAIGGRKAFHGHKELFTSDHEDVIHKNTILGKYCTCELPYNPDLPMIMCDKCEEWYHLKCLEERNNKIELQNSFCCDHCKAKAKKARVE
ncbi:BAH protein [Dunaliella salina]|uniref:BAH protein n=1 Tax=Dunaliella salina TaxID=3046 RepID=A0ABQ7GY55_DUNSA|nr:BAH protein [Dunaliella salina]|eukprot:KAF5839534.1 BAH protein [Dunaliella salina]